jgi:hypothetical protein
VQLESAIDQVYAASPDEFMAVRTALVAEARRDGERELAKQIGALRKPTRSAWLINLLARTAPDEVGALLDLGDALREAQANLSGPELRRLSGERQKAVGALGRRAADAAAEHGHRATDAQLQEVIQHLQAALAQSSLAEDVRAGRVAQIVTFGGFGPFEATEPATPGRMAPERAAAQPDRPEAAPMEPTGPTKAEVDAARVAAERARASAEDAAAAAERAGAAADRAAADVERLQTELAVAQDDAAGAAERQRAARQLAADTAIAANDADQALSELLG